MAKNGQRLSVSTTSFFYQSFSKFHIWIACIKLSLKFEYEFCPTKVNQDGQRTGHHLLVCTYRLSTLVIYYLIAAKFHIYITFINLSQKFEYGLCRITKMAAKWPPPVSLCIFTDHSMAVLLLWIFFVTYVSCLSCYLVVYLLQSCGHLLGKG